MDYRYILVEVQDGVGTITLNRPEVLNSCNRVMVREIETALDRFDESGEVRAILLTGAGRAFCAGQDLAEAVPTDGSPTPDIGDIVAGYNRLIIAMRQLEAPIVCAVNGVAAGAGANIALACDIVLAADSASFIQAFAKIGLIPDNGGTFYLPRLVGAARARALMMLGDKVPAKQAEEWGMIYKAVPAAALMETATALARELATQPTRAFGLIKNAIQASFTNTLEEQLALEAELQREAGKTHDYLEGVRAFQEKRKPSFLGR